MNAPAARLLPPLRRHRHLLLFVALLATISIGPLLEAMDFGHHFMEAFLAVSLLAAVVPTALRSQRYAMYALIVAAMGLRWISTHYASPTVSLAGALLWSAIAVVAAVRCVRYALTGGRVDSERLCAALSAYLLLGVCWGVVYAAMVLIHPNALLVGGAPPERPLTLADSIYFSFVTLATLGYGDLTPTGPVTRGLAVFEAIVGQLYLAILVARLVGLQIAAHPLTHPTREPP
ncbi:MAG TPA: potassium channel family protein [Lysobacter sp.]